MKSILPILLMVQMILFGLSAKSQTTILFEDFEGTGLPTGWTQQTNATDGGWLFGTNTQLQSAYWEISPHTKFAATNDDECNCDKSADLLITPSMDLSAYTTVFFDVDIFFNEGSYQGDVESGTIEISTDGGSTYTTLQTLSGQEDWYSLKLDISAYAGNLDVKIAFNYNDGGGWLFGWAVDNVKIYEPNEFDVSATAITTYEYLLTADAPHIIEGELENLGSATITSLDLNYSIDGGAPVTQSVASVNIPPLGNYSFAHGIGWTPPSADIYTVEVWASNLNGNNDQDSTNDVYSKSLTVVDSIWQRMCLVEQFTSSTCGPCATYNPGLNTLLSNNNVNTENGKVAAIKFQMDYPSPGTDPAYQSECGTRHSYYGVTGIPHCNMGNTFDGHTAGITQQVIDEEYDRPSFIDLTVEFTITADTSVEITTKVRPIIDILSNNLKLHIAVVEDQINHTIETNGENEFYQVMRKMIPNAGGTNLPSLIYGNTETVTVSYDFEVGNVVKGSTNLFVGTDNISVVAYVQDNSTKEVLQTAVAESGTIIQNSTSVNYGADKDFSVKVYPNPIDNNANIVVSTEQSGNMSWEIRDMVGRIVMKEEHGVLPAGKHVLPVNGRSLPSGLYFVKVLSGDLNITQKVTVAH